MLHELCEICHEHREKNIFEIDLSQTMHNTSPQNVLKPPLGTFPPGKAISQRPEHRLLITAQGCPLVEKTQNP